jgi:hypothetical protein
MQKYLIGLLLLSTGISLADNSWMDDTWADPAEKRKNLHSGNLVQTTFYNTGLVGRVGPEFSFEWPKGTGDEYIGDISICVGVEYFNPLLGEAVRSVAVTQSPARGRDEVNPADPSEYWTFMPLPGFASPDTNLTAMSHQRLSWPTVWPDKSWPGSWNGYFGRDVLNADQESYFYVDDSRDFEFMAKEMAFRDSVEKSFPGLWEQYFDASQDSALVRLIQPFSEDSLHGGLGLKIAVRGFQWSHALAEDVIFWLYDITNTSDIDYDKVGFGMVCGTLVGGDGDSGDDVNFFDREAEFTYTGDFDDRGAVGWTPVHPGVRNVGYVGYAFLESPGNHVDWIDNDGDSKSNDDAPHLSEGLLTEWLEEGRELLAGEPVIAIDYNDPHYPRYVIAVPDPADETTPDTLRFYWRDLEIPIYAGKTVLEIPGNLVDDNFNGLIDENWAFEGAAFFNWEDLALDLSPLEAGEMVLVPEAMLQVIDPLIDERRDDGIDNDGDWDPEYDDVGSDGQPVTGDLGEGDGVPTPGEPHFDALDITESDQMGLTSFNEFTFPEFSSRNDENIWDRMIPGEFDSTAGEPADHDFLYGSGYFPLAAGETQRISLAVVFGESPDDLYSNLSTVKTIYNENYNFIQPPSKPTVRAVSGDGFVRLYWDNAAEGSIDRISHLRDFEGYRVYRSTDPGFLDAYSITDARGSTAGFAPVAQYDVVNDVEGFFPIALNGTQYYLGENSGLEHSYTDTTVTNGQNYFYAVTAYDRGDPVSGFLPAETPKQASVDAAGRVTLDLNTVYVTPSAAVAGYTPGLVMETASHDTGHATGELELRIIDESRLRDGVTYSIELDPDTTARIRDVLAWEAISWEPDTSFVWNPTDSTYFALVDSIPYDSTLVLFDEVRVDAIAWSMKSDSQEPARESFIVNVDTPQQRLSHAGIDAESFVATLLGSGDTLHIHALFETLGDGTPVYFDTLNATGAFDMDFDAAKVIYTPAFLDTIETNDVVETEFFYSHNLVHRQLVPKLQGYALEINPYDRVVEGVQPTFMNDWTLGADPDQTGWQDAADDILPWSMRPLALLDFSAGYLQELKGELTPHDFRQEFVEGASGDVSLDPADFPRLDLEDIAGRLVPSVATSYHMIDNTDADNPVSLPFWVYNVKLNSGPPWERRDPAAPFHPLDVVIVLEESSPADGLSWMFQIAQSFIADEMTLPVGGELYNVVTRKPFTAEDSFSYTVQAATWNPQSAAEQLSLIKVVPNPYLATAGWESRPIKGNRGDRKIQFIHLPPRATVRIYTVRGELVATLEHDAPVWDGSLDWNLKSHEGLDVAYGMYFYHLDSPAGESTGKFALIK